MRVRVGSLVALYGVGRGRGGCGVGRGLWSALWVCGDSVGQGLGRDGAGVGTLYGDGVKVGSSGRVWDGVAGTS